MKRGLTAAAASIVLLGVVLLTGSCGNPLNWALLTWASLDMVTVPGGTLTVGDVEGYAVFYDEAPTHNVTISTFQLSRFEVTQQLYLAVMGSNPSYFKPANGFTDEPFRPVEVVSWQDAILFCNALSREAGLTPVYSFDGSLQWVSWNRSANGYRLPTEAEWEFAARGGTASGGYWLAGSDFEDNVAWHSGNSVWDDMSMTYITNPVGMLGANELGLYDMSGNVCEWVWDAYYDIYYGDNPQGWTDPTGPALLDAPINQAVPFVFRGGSTNSIYENLRSARRFAVDDLTSYLDLGLRVARNN